LRRLRQAERQYRGDTLTTRPALLEVSVEPNRFRHYIGIEWATEAHRICLLDNGQLCAKVSIAHSGAGLNQLLEWLASHGVEQPTVVSENLEEELPVPPHGVVVARGRLQEQPLYGISGTG
jgi:hypothetical protein